ncbi:MAG: PAS domain-containing protein [Acidobacteriota bacterium]
MSRQGLFAGPLGSLSPEEREAAGHLLRQRAEAIAQARGARPRARLEGLSLEETQEILHELMVHHIELEMQNEELHRVQEQLDAARARYFDLYDLAPLGYCTLDELDVIVEANLTLADLLSVSRDELVDLPISRFIYRDDEDVFYLLKKRLATIRGAQSRELRMVKSGGTPVPVSLVASLGRAADGTPELRCMVTDISGRKPAGRDRTA